MKLYSLIAAGTLVAASFSVGAAQAQDDWTGFYAGLHGGFVSGDATLTDELQEMPGGPFSGLAGGVLAGYNFDVEGPLVIGVEADFGISNASGTGSGINVEYLYELQSNGHVRLRAGFPSGTVMPFVAAGLAMAEFNVTRTLPDNQMMGGTYLGATVGAGLDLKLAPNAIIRAEVLYDVFGPKTYGDCVVDVSTVTARVATIFQF